MQITFDTATASQTELLALSALIGVLSGRPDTVTSGSLPAIVQYDPHPTGEQRVDAALTPVDHSDQDEEIVSAAVAAGAPAHDSAGTPWDERIHSASRATVADGTWRRRKNTPQETFDAVMAELSAGPNAVPTPPSSQDDTPLPPAEPAVTETPVAAAVSASDDTPPPPPADDGAPDLSTFPKFVQAVNGKAVAPELKTYTALNKLCTESFGVAAFKDMKDRPGDWAMFYDMVG